MDRILVRKYASSEPMVSIGEEQSNQQSSGVKIQDLAYIYDANGNITRIVDASAISTSKTADYVYDSLNRLISGHYRGQVLTYNKSCVMNCYKKLKS